MCYRNKVEEEVEVQHVISWMPNCYDNYTECELSDNTVDKGLTDAKGEE